MKLPLKTLEPNTKGRDFVIGDLHGSYSAFKNLLANLNFDKEVDRIISVGDLGDRGPDSINCLELIYEPWFHAVLSNHEQMMIEKFNGGYMGNYWYANGGDWGMEAYNDYKAIYIDHTRSIPSDASAKVFDLLPLIEELPFLITVNMEDGKKFHVIHAELPYFKHGIITDEILADPAQVLRLAKTRGGDGDSFLWSRYLFGSFMKSPMLDRDRVMQCISWGRPQEFFTEELSHVISGHTILRQPMTIVGHTNIDTGAYMSYWIPVEPYQSGGSAPQDWAGLTCIELKTWKFFKATANKFEEVVPYTVTKEDIKDYADVQNKE